MNIQESKKNLENALQDYIIAQYGEDHFLGDYIFSVQVLDMSEGVNTKQALYMHDGRGQFHSLRGLTAEQDDYLNELKEEEKQK